MDISKQIGRDIINGQTTEQRLSSDYPEHKKMANHNISSQVIGEFIEWLMDAKKWQFGVWDKYSFDVAPFRGINDLLAEYFDIDLDVIETEKLAMLEEIRAANGVN